MNATRPSLPATCLGVVAMTTLLVSSYLTAWPLALCIAALLGTHLTGARLGRSSYVPLAVRLLLFPAVFLLSSPSSFGVDWIFEPATLRMLGQVEAVELCLQHWKHTPSHEKGRFPIASLLLSSLVFLAGANVSSYSGSYILLLTPLFMGLLGCALLDWKPGRINRRAWALLGACWGAALVGGWGVYNTAMVFKNQLMGLGSQFLRDSQVAGLSNQPRLGSRFENGDSLDSPRRVLRVEGELNDPHLRAASFDSYERGIWGPALAARGNNIDNNTAEATLRTVAPSAGKAGRASTARITRLAAINDSPVFVPLNVTGVRATESADIDGPSYDFERATGLLRCTEPDPFTYEITESTQSFQGIPTAQGLACAPRALPPGSAERDKYLQLPDGFDERITQMANEATIDDDTPAERVASLATYLLSNHRYSRSIDIDPKRDPVEQFLLDKKDAHCEFFAASLALMCRSVGVPARYVVGYLAHEPALGESGVLNVRQRDAHAWTEVWIDGVGWVTADATPGEGRPEARPKVSPTQKWSEWASDLVVRVRNRAARISRGTWGWIIGVPLALWLIVRGRPQGGRRGRRDTRGYSGPEGEQSERLAQLAHDFEKWMAAQKLAPLPSRSWQWFLREQQQEKAALWAAEYDAVRFGFVTDAQLEKLERDLAALKAGAPVQAASGSPEP